MKNLFLFSIVCFVSMSTSYNVKKGKAPWIHLNDGNKIPAYGFGTSAGYGAPTNKSQKAVEEAITAGYRLIDTAEFYKNEDQVGRAIQNKINDGTIRRQDIFVITKLWNDHHQRHQVVPTLQNSLKRLGLDYVDLYLIHWPIEEFINGTLGDTDYLETWEGMEECKSLGLTKSIGVSNFNEEQLTRIIKNGYTRPAVLEIEVNPNLTQQKLTKFCQDNDIAVIAYSPLGSIPDAKKKKNSPPPSADDPILTDIAYRYNKNTVQVVLRYLVDRGLIPIPKSTTTSRIYENIDIFDFCLTPYDIKAIDAFNKDFRVINVAEWKDHKYYPFNY